MDFDTLDNMMIVSVCVGYICNALNQSFYDPFNFVNGIVLELI